MSNKSRHASGETIYGTEDELDLSDATLFADSNRGVYIPQYFAQTVKRELVTGVSDEDYKVLEAGPEHEHYWDAWADVLDNSCIHDPKLGDCYLHHDGDLWVVPSEKEEEVPTKKLTSTLLGHQFRPMREDEHDCFAGAADDSLVCDLPNDTILIWSQKEGILSEIYIVDGETHQNDWSCTVIL